MDNLILIDEIARNRICTEINKNFFVEASAGSGKTTALVARMTAMVGAGIDIRRICAITFTKAAAKEFYMRFQSKLDQERRKPDIPKEKCKLYEQALVDIDLCFLGTIDSFCNMILSEHPVEAEIPMDSSILSSEDLLSAYRREWLAMKQGEYGQDLLRLFGKFEKWQDRPDDVFDCAIQSFMKTRDTVRVYSPIEDCNIDTLFADEKKMLCSIATAILAHPEIHKPGKGQEQKIDELRRRVDVLNGSWSGKVSRIIKLFGKMDGIRLLSAPEDIGIMHTEYFEYPEGRKRDWVLNLKESCSAYRKLCEMRYSATMEMLDKFTTAAAPRLKERGELDFFDYILYLRDLLRDDVKKGGRLTEHIYKRHSYFLIDEFQDTNPIQAEIFFYLTAQNPNEDWKKCVPRPGSLFIVGDPKQSIYRFNNADVPSFLRVKSLFDGDTGEVLYLYRNFRSVKVMRDWFNKVFYEMMPKEDEYQSSFGLIPSNKKDPDKGKTTGFAGVCKFTSNRNTDPSLVADIITSLVRDESKLISYREGNDTKLRRIEYDDIMLITRTKTHLMDYMGALSAKQIPFRIEGKTVFSECRPLGVMVAVFGSLAAPMDSSAIYYALKSELFNITDADILVYREKGGKLALFEKTRAVEGNVADALDTLFAAMNAARGYPPSVAFELTSQTLEILSIIPHTKLDYYYFAIELLKQSEVNGEISTTEDASAFLSELLGDAKEREMNLLKKASGVHIANLHKVKGLEAPIVILADPNTKRMTPDSCVDRRSDKATSTFFKIAQRGGTTHASTEAQNEMLNWEQSHLAAEECRLKYVAATRAQNAIFVASQANLNASTNTWREFALQSDTEYQYSLFDTQPEFKTEKILLDGITQETKKMQLALECAESPTYVLTRPSLMKVKSRISPEDDYEDMIGVDIGKASKGRHAALIGTTIHRMMEILVSTRGTVDTDKLAMNIIDEFDMYGDIGEVIFGIIKASAERIKNGGYKQENGTTPDILAEIADADTVMCEVPFCITTSDERFAKDRLPIMLNGVIDLLYKKSNSWYIVDYKTNAEGNNLDEKYAEQLNAYAYAFREMTGISADTRVYHIDV